MNRYLSSQVAELFGVSSATVRNWAVEFAEYLSTTAQPSKGGRYVFVEDDLRVFALVHQAVKRGLDYKDIHAELQNGQRGEVPEFSQSAGALVPLETSQQLVRLKDEIDRLGEQIEALRTERDQAVGQVAVLRSLLDSLIQQLVEENARLKTKGGV